MKIKHLFLGVALVALMAACGGNKEAETVTETVTETPVEETVTETPAEPATEEAAPAEKPAAKPAKATASKAETKKVDACEAKVKAFEKYVDQLKEAKKNKTNGAAALKAYAALVKQAAEMESTIQECKSNPDYKTRLGNALVAEKTARS